MSNLSFGFDVYVYISHMYAQRYNLLTIEVYYEKKRKFYAELNGSPIFHLPCTQGNN
jgi:hypothetical protein